MTPPKLYYWIKFHGEPPHRYSFNNLDDMWHTLRDMMFRDPQLHGIIEWMVRDY